MASGVRLIGIDCAVRAECVGVAVASLDEGNATLENVMVGTGRQTLREAMAGEIGKLIDDAKVAILALDAPLGWPAPLARALEGHRAGERLGDLGDADPYVYRRTDAVVFEHLGVWPLDVGANYIARTAFAALELLAALREGGRDLPMLSTPGPARRSGVIEVYPKATFLARKLVEVKAYKSAKREKALPAVRRLLAAMKRELTIPAKHDARIIGTDHALDAVACVLAAKDFLDGNVVPPTEDERPGAEREGWIWFRRPDGAFPSVHPPREHGS
jgi:hypothetical protein